LSYEIVYTSSPRGLKDGDRGFCTVAATSGTPRLLNEKLESLSGYRHAFDAASDLNPVNYSFLIVQIQNERYYVLSRIADAGNDYSGRNNKIAHHLALSAADVQRVNSAPNVLLSDSEFWITAWDRKPQKFPAGRMPSPHEFGGEGCQTWNKVFGDSGWAGLLARAARYNFKPVWVIVPSGENNLALLNEAVRLVSPEDRWKVCFSTYFTRMSSSSDYNWRFVLEGTDEAKTLRARPTGIVIDPLHSGDELLDDNPFVEAARSGDVSELHATTTQSEQFGSRRPMTRSQIRRRQAAARAKQIRLAKTRQPVARPEYTKQLAADPVRRNVAPPRRKQFWWILATGILIACVVIFLVVRLVFMPSETTWLEKHGLSEKIFALRSFLWEYPDKTI
jgi:hypothetical protein